MLIEPLLASSYMNYSKYMSEVSAYERIELDDAERSFLFKIINGQDSAYKILSYYKLRRQTMSYKNIQHILRRLQDLYLIEEIQRKFLRGTMYYRLTTIGLFHIFFRIASYPPELLIKYKDNIVLKTLLYPYFEEETIKHSTARFYSTITQYLRRCCETTLYTLDTISSTPNVEDIGMQAKQLEFDLGWHTKALGFKLAVMYNESNMLITNPNVPNDNARIALYEVENDMKTLLSKDDKFMCLILTVKKEFEDGYKELIDLKKDK
jgi:hypothetical protein